MTCTGRRRRRMLRHAPKGGFEGELPSDLEGSLMDVADEDNKAAEVEEKKPKKNPRFFFKVWKTSSATTTITVFSTNRSVTVSVSAFCTIANININLCWVNIFHNPFSFLYFLYLSVHILFFFFYWAILTFIFLSLFLSIYLFPPKKNVQSKCSLLFKMFNENFQSKCYIYSKCSTKKC